MPSLGMSERVNADVLFLSFDGLTDPLGRSQVLPYLEGLARRGHRIRIVSLEKPALFKTGRGAVEQICTRSGLGWHPLPYRTWPPVLAGMTNLRVLRQAAERLHCRDPADFTHCRADLPAIAGLKLKRRHGLPLLFDMRSFWADERAEGGQWPQSNPIYRLLFRYFKHRQRELLAEADEVVTLSEEGRRTIDEMGVRREPASVTVIPCCADFDLFQPLSTKRRFQVRSELGVGANTPLLVHVGSFGCNCLLEEMLDFFKVYRDRHPGAQFLFVAPSGAETLRKAAQDRALVEATHFRSASREEVPRWLGAADVGIMFVRPVWSKKAASPTKLGEMLAVGLPVVANSGIGDVAAILGASKAGVVVERFDGDSYGAAIERLGAVRAAGEQIRQEGRRWLDLAIGIDSYDAIYRRLASTARGTEPHRV